MDFRKRKRIETDLIQKVANNIKYYRIKNKLTKEQLQDMTGITISRCESGKHDMTLTTLGILSRHLGIKPSQLLK